MEVRDPIHGLVEYNDTEEKIINSEIFQRLRGIKQLALASLVYPGAHHTRFEHSVGVMHLAGKVGKCLKLPGERVKILRLAGLLHDIGHGPFSHVSEQIIEKHIDKNILYGYKAQNVQELMSILLIEINEEIKKILSADEIDKVKALLQKQERRTLDKDIISGPIDADKFDYLLRDSYFAGVKYGTYDLDKVIESLSPVHISRNDQQLGIREEGIYSIEQLLLAKYHMNVQVYQHRLRRITDAMLVRGIEFALNEGLEEIEKIYKFKDDNVYFNNFIKFDDEGIFRNIIAISNGWAGKFFERLRRRQIFKEVFQVEINAENFDDSVLLNNASNPSENQIKSINEKVADFLRIPTEMVIVDIQNISNPTFKQQQVSIDTSEIMVINKLGKRKNFTAVSTIFRNPSIEPKKEIIYIYAPLDEIESHEEKKKFISNNRHIILNLIKEELK